MDITPIYDLRDRLRAAMIAGTGLLAEDFRLKRAVEAFAPLEKASPVFARIGELSRGLIMSGGEEGRECVLLDAITLVDAVCCTQGAVGVSGELVPVFRDSGTEDDSGAGDGPLSGDGSGVEPGAALSRVPYSTLKPLQEALTTSGSGHYAFVQECHRKDPALFQDYRVRGAMVQALGASYGELADDVRDWLLEDGADVVPLLMRGFDPKGKKEMVRRIQIIDKWMGGRANAFYIEQLEAAEGELRQNLILALRHTSENIERLDGMRKTEKGNARKAACHALAYSDDERVQRIFEEMYRKKPVDTLYYLQSGQAPWAARLAARGVEEQLLAVLEKAGRAEKDAEEEKSTGAEKGAEAAKSGRKGQAVKKSGAASSKDEAAVETKLIAAMEYALFGKSGREVCQVIGRVAKYAGKYGSPLHMSVLHVVCSSLIGNATEEMLALAAALYEGEEGEKKYFPGAFLARLIAGDGTDWQDWLEEQLFGENPVPAYFLAKSLEYLVFHKRSGTYTLETSIFSEADGRSHVLACPVLVEVKGRFLEQLLRRGDETIDRKLAELFDPGEKEVCARLEEYFYKKAYARGERDFYLQALKRCGCARCEGLLVRYAQVKRSIWELGYYVSEMPGNPEAKRAEISRIPELVKSGKVKVSNWNEANYMAYMQNWL